MARLSSDGRIHGELVQPSSSSSSSKATLQHDTGRGLAASQRYPLTNFKKKRKERSSLPALPSVNPHRTFRVLPGEKFVPREPEEPALLFHFGNPHGCGSGRGDVSAGHPAPESADASDVEPEEGQSEAEKAKGVGCNPDMSVRRLAAGREGLFLLSGKFRWGSRRLFGSCSRRWDVSS